MFVDRRLLATARTRWLVVVAAGCVFAGAALVSAQEQASNGKAASGLDRQIMAIADKGSSIMSNLTYLSDVIGPRLTGSAALKRANEWTMGKMKEYGLENVHLEAWSMPEGWERGMATARMIEPDHGRTISLASMAWCPGTPGKVTGNVVIVKAKTVKELEAYKGKLKDAIVLTGEPAKLRPLAEMDKGNLFDPKNFMKGKGKGKGMPFNFEEIMEFRRRQSEFMRNEGVAVMLQDSGKHHGLLNMTGSWGFGGERGNPADRLPTAFVAHEPYKLLWRLASEGKPCKIEIEMTNKSIPGPIAVYNTIGEIRGSQKPEEVVVCGAHLDSWDLGQGTLDNGTGSMVVLETARILKECGTQPKRTVRFILFTGEEQGLHGSREYLKQHKDEQSKIDTAIVHDTGTGRVQGLGWMGGQEKLKPIIESEFGCLKELGVTDLLGKGFGGSDHASFSGVGIPAVMFRQEIAGYGFAHHSQADTITMAREPDLIQGAKVMAIMAMHFANMNEMLPRIEPTKGFFGGGPKSKAVKPAAPKETDKANPQARGPIQQAGATVTAPANEAQVYDAPSRRVIFPRLFGRLRR